MVLHNQFQDFVLFLYIHMAISDDSLHECEEQVILNKMTKLFPDMPDSKKKLQAALAEYRTLNNAQAMEVIRESFAHFDKVTAEQKDKVFGDMYDIVNADGKVEGSEKAVLTDLKAIIAMSTPLRQGLGT